ncbi:ABC transporter ATP-binding protein [Alkalihalobacillus sp. NPDC078783]
MLSLEGVSKKYGDREVLKNITFDVEEGIIFAVLGHNGAGKTTLIKCIMELTDCTGNISYAFSKKDLYGNVSLQMQSSVFEDDARVYEICQFYKKMYGSDVNLEELLEEFGLLDFKKSLINNLSGGEKQKLSILLTLINQPKIIIFDEITTGLDILARRKIWNIIKRINKEYGTTIILTSHFLDEIEYLAQEVLIIEKGEKILNGSVKEIIDKSFSNKKQISFSLPETADKSAVINELQATKNEHGKYEIEFDPKYESEMFEKVVKCHGSDINVKNYSFEDAFLKTLGYSINENGEINRE